MNAAFTIQHSTFNIQRFPPRMLNVEYSIQHSTFNIQHSTLNMQHSAFSIQHSTFNIQHSTFTIHHSTFTIQHSSRSRGSLSFRAAARAAHRRPPIYLERGQDSVQPGVEQLNDAHYHRHCAHSHRRHRCRRDVSPVAFGHGKGHGCSRCLLPTGCRADRTHPLAAMT